MSLIQESLFDLLLNALLQIGFFAIVAAVFSRIVAKARAKHQYCFYLAVLLFCLAVPVINTFWHSPSTAIVEGVRQPVLADRAGANSRFWIWQAHSRQHQQWIVPSGFQSWILGAWGVLVLLQLV